MVIIAVICWAPTDSQLALCQPGQTGVPLCLNQRAGRLLEITGKKLSVIRMCRS